MSKPFIQLKIASATSAWCVSAFALGAGLQLSACSGDSSGGAAKNGGGGGGAPQAVAECVRSGAQPLRQFNTSETHVSSGMGCDKLVPVLSDAPSFRDAGAPTGANADGKTMISTHVFVPAHTPGQRFPVVLHSHGWGGSKLTAITPITANSKDMFKMEEELTSSLVNYGYIVVSFSERGWGTSEGEIAVMAPERETQDAKAVISWIAAEGQAGRLPVAFDDAAETDPRIGSIGVSYGGAYQLLLAAEDPRLDTMVPIGTWHDLIYSLAPHRYTEDLTHAPGVFKHAFTNGLCILAASTMRTRRDDVLVTACAAAPPTTNRMREEWDATNVVVPFGSTHGMRYYRYNAMGPVTASDSKGGFGPRAGFINRGALPALFIQGSRDNLFNMNEAMWNYEFYKSLSPSVEVKLMTNLSGHMSGQWAGQTVEGSNGGKFQMAPAIKAWFKKYLKNDATDLTALALPNVCINLEGTAVEGNAFKNKNGISLNAVPIGNGTAIASSQEVTSATLGANAYVFKKLITISGSDKVLAGVPKLTKVSVCAPAPAPCMRASASTAEQIAFVGVGIKRGSTMILVDEQVFPIRNTDTDGSPSKDFLLPGVAETLQNNDEVGLIYFAKHPQYNISCLGSNSLGPFPACTAATLTPIDFYSMAADVDLPILTVNGSSVAVHSGLEP